MFLAIKVRNHDTTASRLWLHYSRSLLGPESWLIFIGLNCCFVVEENNSLVNDEYNFFLQNHSRHYMFAYLEDVPGGSNLDKLVKDYKKAILSHRRISKHQ